MKKIFINPDDGRLRAGWRIFSFLILFIALAFLGQVVIKAWFGGVPKTTTYLRNSILIIFIAIAASIAVPLARRFLDKKSFISLGLQIRTQSFKDIGFGFLLSGLMVAAFFLLVQQLGLAEVSGISWGEGSEAEVSQLRALASHLAIMGAGSLLFFLLMDVVVSWWEELVFRGYLLQNMMEGMNVLAAVVISCIIYGVVHMTNPNAGLLSSAIIVLFGFLRIYGYLITGQLWLSFGMHIGWNFFQGHIFGFAASGQETPSLILLVPTGPEWLSGGAFGPEGSILVIPLILLALLVMRWWGLRAQLSKNKLPDAIQIETIYGSSPKL